MLDSLGIDKTSWDINGIWNAQAEYPPIINIETNFLLFYVDSIDSMYLTSDGILYDPTGYGFEDAKNKVLRMNDFTKVDFKYSDSKIVYFCLEGCRRVAQFGWRPTKRSEELIRCGLSYWNNLSDRAKQYFIERKILGKYKIEEFLRVKEIYEEYGWGFIFEEVMKVITRASAGI